jgi:VanZ family protein
MNKVTRWLPAILLMLVIFLLSSIPSEEMPKIGAWDTLIKKSGHMLGFGMLALGFWLALQWKAKHAWTAFLLTVVYALADEFHQSFVPGRNPSLMDALGFDAAGAAILILVVFLGKRWAQRRAGDNQTNQ